jgi:hypothetical protein
MGARVMLNYAEDLYRVGFLSSAQKQLDVLDSAFAKGDTLPGEDVAAYLPTRHRVNALMARLAANLDYFGNPAGWAPPIDLNSIESLLERELRESAPLLVLTERMRTLAARGEARISELRSARDAAQVETQKVDIRLNDLAVEIPRLQDEALAIAQMESAFELAVQQRENMLRVEAEQIANPRPSFLLGTLRTIATVAKVVPVAQPLLGGIGVALDLSIKASKEPVSATLAQIPSVAKQFAQIDTTIIGRFRQVVNDVSTFNPAKPSQSFTTVRSAAAGISTILASYRAAQQQARAPLSKVESTFETLKAQDTPFRALIDSAASLSAKKVEFTRRLDAALTDFADATSRLSMLTSSVDLLNTQLAAGKDLVDGPGLQAAADIARGVRSRLDKYHYMLIKAYEYNTGQPYPGNRRAAGVAESIAELLRSNSGDTASAAAFSAAYRNELGQVNHAVVSQAVEAGTHKRFPVKFKLLGADLERINRMLAVNGEREPFIRLPLQDMALFPVRDYEARLIDVRVVSCDCALLTGGAAGANLRFTIIPAKGGLLRSTTRTLGFVQPVERLFWMTQVDLTKNPVDIKPIGVPDKVVRRLSKVFGTTYVEDVFAMPIMLPEVHVRAELLADGPTVARINDLELEITYAALPQENVRGVRVTVGGSNDVMPYFFVGRPDMAGAQHSQGPFTRSYSDAEPVQIIAPTQLGQAVFEGWYRSDNTLVTNSTRLWVPPEKAGYRFEARYRR